MPTFEELKRDHPQLFLHICSFLDAGSLANLMRVCPSLPSYQRSFVRDAQTLFDIVYKECCSLLGGAPSSKRMMGSPGSMSYEIDQLRLFHQVIQVILETLSDTHGSDAPMNVISGEDLLYSVGRLSMMLNDADFLPPEVRPLPVNWTSEKFLKERTKLQSSTVSLISSQLQTTSASQRLPTSLFNEYNRDVRFRFYEILRAELIEKLLNQALPIQWRQQDLAIVERICAMQVPGMLAPSDIRRSLVSLASANKRFLVLISLAPPEVLLRDQVRREVVVETALALSRLLKKNANLLSDTLKNITEENRNHYSLNDLIKARRNQLTNVLSPLNQQFADKMKDVELIKWAKKEGFRNLSLPWGSKHEVALAYAGSVRLIFSQALSIMHEIGDTSSGALDLSYERIVEYTDFLGSRSSAETMLSAFANPLSIQKKFFGELAILLVGIEGSQNNMAVLQAPMCMDLVCSGNLTWAQVLFQRKDIPFFVMGADKSEKGNKPLERHSKVILNQPFSGEELSEGTFPKFKTFFQRELDMNALFFKVFFPKLSTFDRRTRLILSTLIIKHYLCHRFKIGSKARERIDRRVNRLLAPLTGQHGGKPFEELSFSLTKSKTQSSPSPSRDVETVPSRSGQVYPVTFGLPDRVNEILSYSEVAEWLDRAATSMPSRGLLSWMDRVITHLDWQVAELEPDPYERQMFANKVTKYSGQSQASFKTWKMYCEWIELRAEIEKQLRH